MAIAIHVPIVLRQYCGGSAELLVAAATVREALDQLQTDFPKLYCCVCDETGAVRRHVNLFVNNSFVGNRDGLETVLEPGDVLTIMPALSGG